MSKRSAVFAGLAVVVAMLVFAPAVMAVTRATGTITRGEAANTYVLEVANTGTDAIQCLRFFAATGVVITGVSAPATLEAQNRFGAQIQILPGASRLFTFVTQSAYPDNGGGRLDVSATCATGSDVASDVAGPAPAGGPPAAPCECTRLAFSFGSLATNTANTRRLDLGLEWTLFCRAGPGGCKGEIKLATGVRGAQIAPPTGGVIKCSSPGCRPQKALRVKVRITLPARWAGARRAGRSLRVRVTAYCINSAGRRVRSGSAKTMTLAFGRNGRFDRHASDVNGDGRRDDGRRRPLAPAMT